MTETQAEEFSLGHYEFKRVLGEGGFGQVVEAWDPKLHRSIAIKRLKPALFSARPDHLLDEARMAASLKHNAFVKIFSVDGDAEMQSIIMEYIAGSTLRQMLREQPLAERAAIEVVCQVAEAMEEAHGANLIHGDIKPSNLMLDDAGRVRIMDFGLARKLDPDATALTLPEETTGTIAYLAPELLMGGTPNAQSDVYALGVVLYEMVMGVRPFSHLSGLALAAATIQSSSDAWPFAPGTSSGLVSLVRAMTARDLKQRLPSMQAVRAAAEAVRQAPQQALTPASPASLPFSWARLGAGIRKRPGIAWGLGALLVAAALTQLTVSTDWGRAHSPFFSESAAMENGLAALRSVDPDSTAVQAIEQFEQILARHPNHAGAAAGIALAYGRRYVGDARDDVWLQRADASAQLAVQQNDQLALAYVALGVARRLQGKQEEGLKLLEKANSLDPSNVFVIENRAENFLRMGRFDEAEQVTNTGIDKYPKDRIFRDLLGTIYFRQGKYTEAEAYFRKSIDVAPDGVISYANLSAVLLNQGRGDEALAILQKGLQIRQSGQLYSNLGNVLFNRGDYVGAAAAFERAASSSKGSAANYLRWANLGDTLRWIPGRENASRDAYKEAIALLRPLLDRMPNDITLQSRMGLYLARAGDKAQAVALTARAVAAAPNASEVHFRAAMAFELSGNRELALAELKRAQELQYPAHLISAEPDLLALRRDPRYHQPTTEGAK
jgi:eukaryotic-like serine/threonine-protein kinase